MQYGFEALRRCQASGVAGCRCLDAPFARHTPHHASRVRRAFFVVNNDLPEDRSRVSHAALSASRRTRRFVIAAFLLAAVALVGLAAVYTARDRSKTVMYQNKPLDEWFYGNRKQFFNQVQMEDAEAAFNAVGTNAISFLISKLSERRGDGALYFKFYHALPAWLEGRLTYPRSGDDIKAAALQELTKMHDIPSDQLQTLADSVPGVVNPRLRMSAFHLLTRKYQTDPAFLKLGRKLLDDPHPGIQLEAAIYLADSAIAADPQEPRLAPILLDGLQNKRLRDSVADISYYFYQQQPPGAFSRPGAIATPPTPNQARLLQERITTALIRLKPYMSPAQEEKLKELSKPANP